MTIDYSRFDKIDISDDDNSAEAIPKVGTVCSDCGKICLVRLFCGNCKRAAYCSRDCQRNDWKFHKRNCKKEAIESESQVRESPHEPGTTESIRSEAQRGVVIEDEKLEWYKHRDWKPNDSWKEYKPEAVSEVPQEEVPAHKSAWNAADTWEDRDVMCKAEEWLRKEICSIDPTLILDVSDIEGFATISNVRGRVRYLFDLSFKIKMSTISVQVSDFSSCSDSEPIISLCGGSDNFSKSEIFRLTIRQRQADLVAYLASLGGNQ